MRLMREGPVHTWAAAVRAVSCMSVACGGSALISRCASHAWQQCDIAHAMPRRPCQHSPCAHLGECRQTGNLEGYLQHRAAPTDASTADLQAA